MPRHHHCSLVAANFVVNGARAGAQVLYNHLRNALAAQGLATDKGLALEGSEEVADGGQQQEDGRGNQAGGILDDAEELDETHDAVSGRSEVVGRDLADEHIEFRRGRADSKEERYFDEKDNEGGCAVR